MKKSTIIILVFVVAAAGAAAWYFLNRKTTEQKKTALNNWAASEVWGKMTEDEINDTYKFVEKYAKVGAKMPKTDSLYPKINAIAEKYNIFK